MSHIRFQVGSGVYTCNDCGKKTRDISGESIYGLCAKCYAKSELENAFADGIYTQEEYDAELNKIEEKHGR